MKFNVYNVYIYTYNITMVLQGTRINVCRSKIIGKPFPRHAGHHLMTV
jgi:hypothetical protein